MSRFDLNKLKQCGAKTRSGKPCKRFGNKQNGRCKLHGGRSTGAVTKEGKLVVKTNAVRDGFKWMIELEVDEETFNRAMFAYEQLVDMYESKEFDKTELIELVTEYRIDLESVKSGINRMIGPEAFVLIQEALDRYYQETDSLHLHFHLYSSMSKPTFFWHPLSQAQHNKAVSWMGRAKKIF